MPSIPSDIEPLERVKLLTKLFYLSSMDLVFLIAYDPEDAAELGPGKLGDYNFFTVDSCLYQVELSEIDIVFELITTFGYHAKDVWIHYKKGNSQEIPVQDSFAKALQFDVALKWLRERMS